MDKRIYRKWLRVNAYLAATADGEIRVGKNPVTWKFWPDGSPYIEVRAAGRLYEEAVDEIVALAFLGQPPSARGYKVRHLNGVIGDCRAENLVWVPDPDYSFEFYRELMRVPAWYAPGLIKRIH